MRCYTHWDLDDRRRLYQLINAGRSPLQAAVELGRHASTIYRELNRNRHLDEEPVFLRRMQTTGSERCRVRKAFLQRLHKVKGCKVARNVDL